MHKITLNDGTVLDNLVLNGNNFISETILPDEIFEGNLAVVAIEGEEMNGVYYDMVLVANRVCNTQVRAQEITEDGEVIEPEYKQESWFVLAEKSEQQKKEEAYEARIKELEAALERRMGALEGDVSALSQTVNGENADMKDALEELGIVKDPEVEQEESDGAPDVAEPEDSNSGDEAAPGEIETPVEDAPAEDEPANEADSATDEAELPDTDEDVSEDAADSNIPDVPVVDDGSNGDAVEEDFSSDSESESTIDDMPEENDSADNAQTDDESGVVEENAEQTEYQDVSDMADTGYTDNSEGQKL